MNSGICIHCHNKKPINSTNNRLVIESCGHVKCMDCLLIEKSGCIACIKAEHSTSCGNADLSLEEEPNRPAHDDEIHPEACGVQSKVDLIPQVDNIEKKTKPESSHIRVETDESGNRSFVCIYCKKSFHARSHIAYHAYCNGQKKPYQCPECSKSFATHSHFKYHMRVHRNERTYACDVCGDSFFQMSKLQRHKLKHTKEKKFTCSICNKGFNNLTSLRKHGLTHTDVRPYKCDKCDYYFRDQSNYRKHVAKHDDVCSCGECGDKVKCRKSAKLGAARAQVSRRAHQCPRCPQAFHSRKDMRRHYTVHTDKKPFGCKVCSRRFRRKDNLDRHIRNTHPDYVPAAAIDCDQNALIELSTNGHVPVDLTDKNHAGQTYESKEKAMLEILNPLPPLSEDVIQKHLKPEVKVASETKTKSKLSETVADKSYIIEANNARESVIFGPLRKDSITKVDKVNVEFEYVHKIRRAHCMGRSDTTLPPIDEKRMLEIEQKANRNNWDVGAPPKNVELYKKILYESAHKDSAVEDGKISASDEHEMHWRRKMKLNIN